MKLFIKFIGSLLLIPLSVSLFIVLSVFGFGWSFWMLIYDRSLKDVVNGFAVYFLSIALSIDQLGNVAFKGLLTATLIDKEYKGIHYAFGDADETISEALGWNERFGNLSKTGLKLVQLLNWLEEDHCELAMANAVLRAQAKTILFSELKMIVI